MQNRAGYCLGVGSLRLSGGILEAVYSLGVLELTFLFQKAKSVEK